jgi:uncharacterized Zn-finger protein
LDLDSTLCGKVYSHQGGSYEHIKQIYNGERKRYIFDRLHASDTPCGKSYSKKNNLNHYIKHVYLAKGLVAERDTYNHQKPDGTPCGKSYSRKDHLDRHIKQVHQVVGGAEVEEIVRERWPS